MGDMFGEFVCCYKREKIDYPRGLVMRTALRIVDLKAKYIQRMDHYAFFQGMGGGQINTKQNPTQENPCQRYKASYEKAII